MDSQAFKLLDRVCQQIDYASDEGEFWEFPSEMISWKEGDCDGSANLLTSLLRAAGFNAYTAVGLYKNFGHAWTQLDGEILETTFTFAHQVPDPEDYHLFALFNDQEVIEMWPGALSQLFALGRRNERLKLNVMAGASRRAGW